jgi:hypothetical protein
MLAGNDHIAVPDRYHLELARQWLIQLYQAWANMPKPPIGRRSRITDQV